MNIQQKHSRAIEKFRRHLELMRHNSVNAEWQLASECQRRQRPKMNKTPLRFFSFQTGLVTMKKKTIKAKDTHHEQTFGIHYANNH
jgi:hypothetical protein